MVTVCHHIPWPERNPAAPVAFDCATKLRRAIVTSRDRAQDEPNDLVDDRRPRW
jgi:hypothetical protein